MCGNSLAGGFPPVPAERRRMTVLFCDLVNSMEIAGRVDAEDLRDILVEYRRTCTTIVETAGGRVLQLFGDGILAGFGFPSAREDDPRRAVAAALEICRRMPVLSAPVERQHHMSLSVRISVHTGAIVFDDSITGPASQQSGLIGNTLNIGARIQALAPRNGVIISAETSAVVRGYFAVAPLGPQTIPGIEGSVELFEVTGYRQIRSVFEARVARGMSAMVGRESELAALDDEWKIVQSGALRAVLVTGEPGIGKSRLIHEFLQHHTNGAQHHLIFQCSSQFENTAFYPIATELARHFRLDTSNDRKARIETIDAALSACGQKTPCAAEYLDSIFNGAEAEAAPGNGGPTTPAEDKLADRPAVVQTIAAYFQARATQAPLLLIIEDLHWADPSTQEVFALLRQAAASSPILLLATSRIEDESSLHFAKIISLARIPPKLCERLIKAQSSRCALPEEIISELVERSDGVPLFLEELTVAVTESLRSDGGSAAPKSRLVRSIVPASLYESIMSRLDRLGTAKRVAQAAALFGRSFRAALLEHAIGGSVEKFAEEIDKLIEVGIVFRRDAELLAGETATLEFKHELVRAAAGESLLRSTRRKIHARIAATLEQHDPTACARHPEVLAHHYSEAGQGETALPLWELAGTRAVRASANQEAAAHFRRAIELVRQVKQGEERRSHELDLYISLAAPVMATKGYASLDYDSVIERALDLSGSIANSAKVFPLVYGRWSFDQVRGELHRARELALKYLDLANLSGEDEARMIAFRLLGTSMQTTGDPSAAIRYLEQATTLFDDTKHTRLAYLYGADLKVVSLCSLAFAQWAEGLHEAANASMNEAWQRAANLEHAVTTAYCCSYRMAFWMFSGQDFGFDEMLHLYQNLLREHRFPIWVSTAPVYEGFAAFKAGDTARAAVLFQKAVTGMERINLVYFKTYAYMWLGRALARLGQVSGAEAAYRAAHDLIDRTGERWPQTQLEQFWTELTTPTALGAKPGP